MSRFYFSYQIEPFKFFERPSFQSLPTNNQSYRKLKAMKFPYNETKGIILAVLASSLIKSLEVLVPVIGVAALISVHIHIQIKSIKNKK